MPKCEASGSRGPARGLAENTGKPSSPLCQARAKRQFSKPNFETRDGHDFGSQGVGVRRFNQGIGSGLPWGKE